MVVPVVMILVYIVSFGLALFTLLAALRWPLVRGKHILCAALAVELADQAVRVSSIVFFMTQSARNTAFFQAIGVLSFLSEVLGAVLLLLFVLVMGAELRGLLAREGGHEA